jgi:predicted RNA-binding Zn-ribbon protein involved in translation (DUF1610 family)
MTSERLGRLEARVEGDAAVRRIALRGKLDETSPISGRAAAWAAGEVTVDTAEIVFINSIGVREWMRLIRGLTERGAKVRLDRCAEVIIEQINMIDDARGGAEVRSFHAPYQCPACGLEASMLIDVERHDATLRRMQAPAMACPECGQPMELYELPEKFFSFLQV